MESQAASHVVLVVDDDRDIRETLASVLDDHGYATVLASDGHVALQLLQHGLRPCVILLDLSMPAMDGWDFRATQLRDPNLSTIPVVVLTAAGYAAETVQKQLAGVGFVRKPMSLDQLLSAVGEHCLGAEVPVVT